MSTREDLGCPKGGFLDPEAARAIRLAKRDNRLPAGSGIVIAMVASTVFWVGVALWAWTSGGAVLSADGLEVCHADR